MSRPRLAVIACGCAGLVGPQVHAGEPARDGSIGPVLSYRRPASEWVEALPIGNGRLGGMVFGGVPAERIQLNEDTFWSGGPYDPINDEALRYLPQVRQLLWEGRYKEAQDLADEKLMGRPRYLQAYQPLGDLRLVIEGHEHPTDYRRELDLDRAVVRVRYRIGDATFTREVFSSAPDQSIVVHLTADHPARLNLLATLDSKQPFAVRPLPPGALLMSGRWRGDLTNPEDHLKLSHGLQARWYGEGLAFAVQIAAEAEGGRVEADEKGLHVVDAHTVTLRLAAATSFRGRDPEAACTETLRSTRPYGELLAGHLADYRALFRRARLDLGSADRNELPTDERLAAVQKGAVDPGLAAIYFQYGRYLLIASSRPGTQPANLQGIWNDDVNPAWGSKYTININTEMNYWPAEVDQPRRVPRAAVRPDRGAARAGSTHREGALRRPRLGRPPQHRPVARDDAGRRRPLGAVADGRRLALARTSRSTTPSAATSPSCAKAYPVMKGGRGIPARFPRRGPSRAGS